MENHAVGLTPDATIIPCSLNGSATALALAGGRLFFIRRTAQTERDAEVWERRELGDAALPGSHHIERALGVQASGRLVVFAVLVDADRSSPRVFVRSILATGELKPWRELQAPSSVVRLTAVGSGRGFGNQVLAIVSGANAQGRGLHVVYDVEAEGHETWLQTLTVPVEGAVIDVAVGYNPEINPGNLVYALVEGYDRRPGLYLQALDGGGTHVLDDASLPPDFRLARLATLRPTDGLNVPTNLILAAVASATSRLYCLDPRQQRAARLDEAAARIGAAPLRGVCAELHVALAARAGRSPSLRAWARMADGSLYSAVHSDGWFEPGIQARQVRMFAPLALTDSSVEYLMVVDAMGADQTGIRHVVRHVQSGLLMSAPVVLAEQAARGRKDFLEYRSYTIEAHFRGAHEKSPTVAVKSSQDVQVRLNGAVRRLKQGEAVAVALDARGVLVIVGEASSLSAPVFQIAPNFGGAEARSVIEVVPSSEFDRTLGDVSGADLIREKIVAPDRTKYADNAARSIQNLARAHRAQMAGIATAPAGHTLHSSGGRALLRPAGAAIANHIRGSDLDTPFYFNARTGEYAEGPAVAEHLARLLAGQEEEVAARRRAMAVDRALVGSFFGDLFDAIGEAIAAAVEIVVTVTDALIEVVVRVADRVINAIIETAEQLWAAVSSVFAAIGAGFARLFQWLAFVFDWKDIVRTHRVLARGLDLALLEVQSTLTVDATRERHLKTLGEALRDVKAPPEVASADDAVARSRTDRGDDTRSNWGSNHLASGSFGDFGARTVALACARSEAYAAPAGAGNDFIAALHKFAEQLMADLWSFDFSDFLKKGLFPLLGEALDAWAEIVRSTTNLGALLAAAIEVVTTEVQIPILSWLYREIVGDELTLLDALALLLAIPATVLYKLVFSRAPFTEAEVTHIRGSADLAEFVKRCEGAADNAGSVGLLLFTVLGGVGRLVGGLFRLAEGFLTDPLTLKGLDKIREAVELVTSVLELVAVFMAAARKSQKVAAVALAVAVINVVTNLLSLAANDHKAGALLAFTASLTSLGGTIYIVLQEHAALASAPVLAVTEPGPDSEETWAILEVLERAMESLVGFIDLLFTPEQRVGGPCIAQAGLGVVSGGLALAVSLHDSSFERVSPLG